MVPIFKGLSTSADTWTNKQNYNNLMDLRKKKKKKERASGTLGKGTDI